MKRLPVALLVAAAMSVAATTACVGPLGAQAGPSVGASDTGGVHQIFAPEIGGTFTTTIPGGPDVAITVGGGQRGSAGATGRQGVDGDVIYLFVSYRPTGAITRDALPAGWTATATTAIAGNLEMSVPELAANQLASATVEFDGVATGKAVTISYEDDEGVPFTMVVGP